MQKLNNPFGFIPLYRKENLGVLEGLINKKVQISNIINYSNNNIPSYVFSTCFKRFFYS